jgi:cytoskeletal protein CcmA (bactofilin family)
MVWGPLALTAATSGLIGASLAPALIELRKRRDAGPLPTRTDDGHITSFAAGFRRRLEPLSGDIHQCRETGENSIAKFPDGTSALLIGAESLPPNVSPDLSVVALCCGTSSIPRSTELLCDVFASGDVTIESGTTLRALLAAGDIWLGDNCVVCRWLHSDGAIKVAAGSALYGRVSANRRIQVAPSCRFERIHAPVVIFGDAEAPPLPAPVFQKRSIVDVKLGRLLAHGDFHLASGDVLQGHVVASGDVLIEGSSRILGSVKSHGKTEIHNDTQIHGSVVSSASLHISGGSFLRGPLLAEGELFIGPGTVIGTPESPTTISAPRIRIAAGAIVHGSVWARYEGYVEAEGAAARNNG